MLQFVEGDLLGSKEAYIAQGVAEGNQEGLGTGLAQEISTRWPEIQIEFKRFARTGRFKGGQIWSHPGINDSPGVVYLATQPDMYHATLPYLRKSLRRLRSWAEKENLKSVGLPKIGAGLGKLSWENDVKPILIDILVSSDIRFVVYETFTHEHELESG